MIRVRKARLVLLAALVTAAILLVGVIPAFADTWNFSFVEKPYMEYVPCTSTGAFWATSTYFMPENYGRMTITNERTGDTYTIDYFNTGGRFLAISYAGNTIYPNLPGDVIDWTVNIYLDAERTELIATDSLRFTWCTGEILPPVSTPAYPDVDPVTLLIGGVANAGEMACGTFPVNFWGIRTIDPAAFPGCADYSADELMVACYTQDGKWVTNTVTSWVADGLLYAKIDQHGTCGIFPK
jgi:hypothetical protein